MDLVSELSKVLDNFVDIQVTIIKGLTHTHVRVKGQSTVHVKYDFSADVFVYRRTKAHSIARIDTKDVATLKKITDVLHLQFK